VGCQRLLRAACLDAVLVADFARFFEVKLSRWKCPA
jgi:hypothetical protein